MSYNIYKADGTAVTVPDNAIDVQFYDPTANGAGKGIGTQLVGRNAIDYGAPVAQNFLQITENFASNGIYPTDAKSLIGQLWFNKSTASLFVKVVTGAGLNSDNWRKIAITNPVTPGDGDIRVVGSVISIWANGAWQQVFPAVYS